MRFLRKIFGKKDKDIQTASEFWHWFTQHQDSFFKSIKSQHQIEKKFLNKVSDKLNQLKDGYYFLTGMYDEHTVELIFTADGAIENIVFVEDLVQAAPDLKGWRFTALKPVSAIESLAIEMNGYAFNEKNCHFYSNDLPEYPDEIDITVLYDFYEKKDHIKIVNGVHLFLDNYLGELKYATSIDNLTVAATTAAEKPLIPINKLAAFLTWREAEFIEKYEGETRDTDLDRHILLEAQQQSGKPFVASINQDALEWDRKASHPWIVDIEFKFDGDPVTGMPDDAVFEALNDWEEQLQLLLKNDKGYLYIGRQTCNGIRNFFFACREFRKPSKVLYNMQQDPENEFEMDFSIYKDKYWQSFQRFRKSEINDGDDD